MRRGAFHPFEIILRPSSGQAALTRRARAQFSAVFATKQTPVDSESNMLLRNLTQRLYESDYVQE